MLFQYNVTNIKPKTTGTINWQNWWEQLDSEDIGIFANLKNDHRKFIKHIYQINKVIGTSSLHTLSISLYNYYGSNYILIESAYSESDYHLMELGGEIEVNSVKSYLSNIGNVILDKKTTTLTQVLKDFCQNFFPYNTIILHYEAE